MTLKMQDTAWRVGAPRETGTASCFEIGGVPTRQAVPVFIRVIDVIRVHALRANRF
jgi:hypothetical protein